MYGIYVSRLWAQVSAGPVPRHLAIILDGNRRFTRRSGLGSVRQGYAAGADRVLDVIRWSARAGVSVVTLWAVSLDNLQRPANQVGQLFEVLESAIGDLITVARREGWQLRGIGRSDLL
ncbi:MAG: undecaprenyl diphosphate synthase family protein, partial [Acidimicrobiales bacterium]